MNLAMICEQRCGISQLFSHAPRQNQPTLEVRADDEPRDLEENEFRFETLMQCSLLHERFNMTSKDHAVH